MEDVKMRLAEKKMATNFLLENGFSKPKKNAKDEKWEIWNYLKKKLKSEELFEKWDLEKKNLNQRGRNEDDT